MLVCIQKLDNKAVYSASLISWEQAVHALKNLYRSGVGTLRLNLWQKLPGRGGSVAEPGLD